MSKKTTDLEDQQMAEMYANGVPESVIREKYEVSHYAVYKALDKHNIPRRNYYSTSKRATVIKRLPVRVVGRILDDVDSGVLSREAIVEKYDLKSEHVVRELIRKRDVYQEKLALLGDLHEMGKR